jgi:acyl-CoA synthetase (AMP-forming)/AMP-acid ligase II
MPSRPWFDHYDADVPRTLAPYPEQTLLDLLAANAHAHPRHPITYLKGRAMTYAELDRRSDACAAAFAALGVRPGDRVAIGLPNVPQFLIAEFGAWKAGAIACPFNPTYTEHELEDALNATDAELVVTLNRFYEKVKRVQPRTKIRRVIPTNVKEYLPRALAIAYTLLKGKERRRSHRPATRRRPICRAAGAVQKRSSAAGACRAVGSGSDPHERRDNRHAEGRRRSASRNDDRRTAAAGLAQPRDETMDRRDHASAAALSHLRQHRRAESGIHQPQSRRPHSRSA